MSYAINAHLEAVEADLMEILSGADTKGIVTCTVAELVETLHDLRLAMECVVVPHHGVQAEMQLKNEDRKSKAENGQNTRPLKRN